MKKKITNTKIIISNQELGFVPFFFLLNSNPNYQPINPFFYTFSIFIFAVYSVTLLCCVVVVLNVVEVGVAVHTTPHHRRRHRHPSQRWWRWYFYWDFFSSFKCVCVKFWCVRSTYFFFFFWMHLIPSALKEKTSTKISKNCIFVIDIRVCWC